MQQISKSVGGEREMVWQIDTSFLSKNKIKDKRPAKEPIKSAPVKDLIEKTFAKISSDLLSRLAQVESELENLRQENTELKNKFAQINSNE